ncbi:MAG: hypothetical protein GY703_12980 [Gammaproteobacteria bacterium]|nr:hypothetical protein [Gammaproteobacteria bacterium]
MPSTWRRWKLEHDPITQLRHILADYRGDDEDDHEALLESLQESGDWLKSHLASPSKDSPVTTQF